ncbi:hypothetical protein SDC9_168144 [bioreactor metagenome]|uniref:Uncharacterized protein n=1 Tax=bioreactor metagenome TaxID=1076179 RepID=A0A645G2A6_9ZZZZ
MIAILIQHHGPLIRDTVKPVAHQFLNMVSGKQFIEHIPYPERNSVGIVGADIVKRFYQVYFFAFCPHIICHLRAYQSAAYDDYLLPRFLLAQKDIRACHCLLRIDSFNSAGHQRLGANGKDDGVRAACLQQFRRCLRIHPYSHPKILQFANIPFIQRPDAALEGMHPCIKETAAQLIRSLQQFYLMSAGCGISRRFHAADASANHHHMLRLNRFRHSIQAFLHSLRIHGAGGRAFVERRGHTVAAGNAGTDFFRSSHLQLLDIIWIC